MPWLTYRFLSERMAKSGGGAGSPPGGPVRSDGTEVAEVLRARAAKSASGAPRKCNGAHQSPSGLPAVSPSSAAIAMGPRTAVPTWLPNSSGTAWRISVMLFSGVPP
jgi:hypothetical protein